MARSPGSQPPWGSDWPGSPGAAAPCRLPWELPGELSPARCGSHDRGQYGGGRRGLIGGARRAASHPPASRARRPLPARGARGYAERQEGTRRRGPGRGGCCGGGEARGRCVVPGMRGERGDRAGPCIRAGGELFKSASLRLSALVSPLQTFLRVRANRQTRLNGECGPHRACPSREVSGVGPSCVAPSRLPHRRPGAATRLDVPVGGRGHSGEALHAPQGSCSQPSGSPQPVQNRPHNPVFCVGSRLLSFHSSRG